MTLKKIDLISIQNSSEPKIVGRSFPQTEELSPEIVDDLDYLSTQKGKYIEKRLSIRNILLRPDAKLTDAISCSLGAGNDMIVSNRLKEILMSCKLGPIQFFDMSFNFKGKEILDYSWMHIVYQFEEFINYSQTEYNIKAFPELASKKIRDYNAYIDFQKLHDKYGLLRSIKTVMNNSFKLDMDIFTISWLDQNLYITKDLYEKFRREKITGLEYDKRSIFIG